MGNMMERLGKKMPSFLFLQSGHRGSGEVKVPLASGGDLFSFLTYLWGTHLHPGGGHREMVTPRAY